MDTQDVHIMITKFVSALTLSLCLIAPAQAAPELIDQVVAVVDDDVIMASELDMRIRTVELQNSDMQIPDEATLRSQVLERMVEESIQLQMAQRAGIRISESQLNEAMQRIAQQNGMTLPEFQQAMSGEGVSFSYAREQIRNEMRISRVQQYQVGERIQITDQDIDYFLSSEIGRIASAAEYHLRHILISVPAAASPDDYQAAEEKAGALVTSLRSGEDFASAAVAQSSGVTALKGGDMGWRKEGQLPGIFAELVKDMNVGDISDPISTASGFHIIKLEEKRGGSTQIVEQTKASHILIRTNEVRDEAQAETLINQLYQRAQSGEDFAELAKEFSDDPGSGSIGGELGWVSPGEMVPEFDSVMATQKVGTISEPLKSRFGWHIIKVEDRRQADMGEEIQRNQVRQMLYGRRFEEELPIWLRKIRSEAYVDIKEGV